VLQQMLPLDDASGARMVARTGDIISASVHGVVVDRVLQGVLGGLMFWALALPSPLIGASP